MIISVLTTKEKYNVLEGKRKCLNMQESGIGR